MNWQPIETAPKDGTEILVGRWIVQGYFHQGKWVDKGKKWTCTSVAWEKNTWILIEWGTYAEFGELSETPTYWMPLPPPPRDEGDTFTAHGLTWRKHTPGDLMPCEGEAVVRVLMKVEVETEPNKSFYENVNDPASTWDWGARPEDPESEILGWNYAD